MTTIRADLLATYRGLTTAAVIEPLRAQHPPQLVPGTWVRVTPSLRSRARRRS